MKLRKASLQLLGGILGARGYNDMKRRTCCVVSTLLILSSTLVGCFSKPRIDASSDEAVAASIERVRESLPEHDRLRFDVALYSVTLSRTFGALGDTALAAPNAVSLRWIAEPLDGLTGDQVIAKGDSVRREMERREAEL